MLLGTRPPAPPGAPRARTAVAAVIAAAAVACGSGGDGGLDQEGRAWRPAAGAPLSGRFLPAAVWTGREVLLWGGASCPGACDDRSLRRHADGAAYDPAADTWRDLPPSPLSPRLGPLAVWSGAEMLVWGGSTGAGFASDGAAFDPAAGRWRPLPASPLADRFDVPPGTVAQVPGIWTGREMLVWGHGSAEAADLPDGAAYDPAADRWRVLPRAPLAPRMAVPVWSGREMLVWGGQAGTRYFDDGAAYDPAADTWRPLPPSPLAARFTFVVWSGREMLVWGGESGDQAFDDGAAYDPAADTWRPLPPSPLGARRGFALVWTGREMVVWGGAGGAGRGFPGTGAAYDPAAGRWREVDGWAGRLLPVGLATATEVFLWGGIVFTGADLLGSSAEGALLTP